MPLQFYCHIVHRSVSLQLFPVVWIFSRSLGVICYNRWVLSTGHRIYFKDLYLSLINSKPTFWFWHFLTQWDGYINQRKFKPDNFKLHNSLKLSSTNIWGLCSNFVEFESSLESKFPHIFVPFETSLGDLTDSGNFSVKGYLPLIRKILLLICMVLQFMWRKDFLLHGLYPRKLCRF